ncbi:DUF1360 domain-containing protein [Raoultella terrigena]|jgi:hypothetical protein|uniref:DUF1360 domain-containing protein n=1 Tax=Raoultella terrigena TaxID=577 RepID=UPI000975AF29|nr:DUF1360 domain-containing protein [Raoultella terrigena]OMP89816.1 DUF1360 domain-containing protein [Raoultella terrigena]
MIATLTTCLMIALAASSISITVTQTELFASFREWTAKKNALVGHLFQCFYCLSHWVVFGGMAVYRPALLNSGFALVDWVMTAFITITFATLISGLMFKVFQAAIGMHVMKHEAQKTLPAK